jgi:hypothetical protein
MFKFEQKNNNGTFVVELTRDLSKEEALQIMQIATNLLYDEKSNSISSSTSVYGPHPQNYYPSDSGSPVKISVPSAILDPLKFGTYKEPKDGVRLKILSLNSANKLAAVKAFREKTGISLMGARDIIIGTHFCPKLKPEVAEEILLKFKEINVHAKIATTERSAQA